MYKSSFAVIGIGTLGGFVAEALSKLDSTEEIVLVDHDVVERKNLKNSIYRPIDVGLLKVTALSDIVNHQNPGVRIKAIQKPFIENAVIFSEFESVDLIFDCRDHTYDRKDLIDVRVYISSRYVIVDCRKNISYPDIHEGRYLVELTKDDLRNASFIVSMLVYNNTISQLIKSQAVQKYELDHLKKVEPKYGNIVYECNKDDKSLINLPSNIMPIIEANRKKDLNVYVGSKQYPISEMTIPRNTLKTGSDVIINLTSFVNMPCSYPHYIVSIHPDGYVEMIPETGAA